MKIDNRTIGQVLQAEIDRCKQIVDRSFNSTQTWGKTVAVLINRDIQIAEKALADKNDTAMFRALRALRQNN